MDPLQAALAELKKGNLAFDAPREMTQGSRERVRVRIARNLTTQLTGGPLSGTPEVQPIPTGPFMTVQLSGDGFEIKPLTPSNQLVEPVDYTEWNFDVLPLESGNQTLILAVGVRLKLASGEEAKFYPVLEKSVNVAVDPVYSATRFASAHWQWFVSAVMIPVVGWAFARRTRRHRRVTGALRSRIRWANQVPRR